MNPTSSRLPTALPTVFRLFLTCVLFLSFLPVARACWFKKDVDFSNYDKTLYEQVTDRIQDKIQSRLGDARSTRDRYFIIPFAYQNKGNDPKASHSFMTVIRVFADKRRTSRTSGLIEGKRANRRFEAFTISWAPADFAENPDLCVFKGFGSRLIPENNQCPLVPGRSFTLRESLQFALNNGNAVCMWGPYEITKDGFDLGVKRLRLLEGGTIKYRADDRLTRKDRSAINCFHAMAGLTELFPNGGLFGTGFKMWGINGTARVLLEYQKAAAFSGLILEPVNEKADRHGFVFAEKQDSKTYNPFQTASAYHR
jgi:hypothetical protein